MRATTCNCVVRRADGHSIAVALPGVQLLLLTWTGHVRGVYGPLSPPSPIGAPPPHSPGEVRAIVHHPDCSVAALLFASGAVAACVADAAEPSTLGTFEVERWLVPPGGGACCGALSATAQMLAIGRHDGSVALWSCLGDWHAAPQRVLSLQDWAYGPEDTGAVSVIDWTDDGQARDCSAICGAFVLAF